MLFRSELLAQALSGKGDFAARSPLRLLNLPDLQQQRRDLADRCALRLEHRRLGLHAVAPGLAERRKYFGSHPALKGFRFREL